jgi:hypothetical protein
LWCVSRWGAVRTAAALAAMFAAGCADPAANLPVLTADMPLHLEDHLDAAVIEGSELPAAPPEAVAALLSRRPVDRLQCQSDAGFANPRYLPARCGRKP